MWSILFVLAFSAPSAFCYFTRVDSYEEMCFFERVKTGDKLHLLYEVTEGGFLDIDVEVKSADGVVIYHETKRSDGKVSFTATQDGMYTYCFRNGESSIAPKTILFDFLTDYNPLKNEQGASDIDNKLNDMVNELSVAINSMKHDVEYLEVREEIHRSINESTNSRVVLWAAFEAFLLISMSIGQVFYLKRFFEVRRLI